MHRFNGNLGVGIHELLFQLEEWGEFKYWHRCHGWELPEKPISRGSLEQEIILREDISIDQAKEEIMHFLEGRNSEIFISEIIQELRLDLDIVIEVLEQLFDEGYIDRTD